MVAEGDTKTCRIVIKYEHSPNKAPALYFIGSIDRKVILGPKEPRYNRERQKSRANQEDGSYPFDAVNWKVLKLHRDAYIVRFFMKCESN